MAHSGAPIPSPQEVALWRLQFHNIKTTKTYTYSKSHFCKRALSVSAVRNWLYCTQSVLHTMRGEKKCRHRPFESSGYPQTYKKPPLLLLPNWSRHRTASCLSGPKPPKSDSLVTHRLCGGHPSCQISQWQPSQDPFQTGPGNASQGPDLPKRPNNGPFLVCFERFELRLLSSMLQQFPEAHPARAHNRGWQWLKV